MVLSRTAGLVALCLLLAGCSEEKVKPPVSSVGMGVDIPSQESWNATITFSDSGRMTAVLRAGHIATYADKRTTRLDSGIVVDFFDQNERHTSVLTARQGRVDNVTNDFEAHDSVVVVSDSGTTLRTADLYWNNKTQRVTTPGFVDIKSPTEQIQGHGLESDQGLKHYTILKVTGQARTND